MTITNVLFKRILGLRDKWYLKMEFPKIAVILCICVLSISSNTTHEVSQDDTDNPAQTKINENEHGSDTKRKEYKRLLDDNDEDSGDEESYDMSTCKSLIEQNVKGSFNLSAHNLICK